MKQSLTLLKKLGPADLAAFKRAMQDAFQYGYENEFGPTPETILPERDIDQSLNAPGAIAYVVCQEGTIAGGAVVKIDPETRHNQLELLFVSVGFQGRGVGQTIWNEIEARHPETVEWETFTPYFEKRNIHFYVNCCGFHIVEFYHPGHRLPDRKEGESCGGMSEEAGNYFFRFVKTMKDGRR